MLEESERVKEQLTVQETNLRLAEFEGKSAVRARDGFLTVSPLPNFESQIQIQISYLSPNIPPVHETIQSLPDLDLP